MKKPNLKDIINVYVTRNDDHPDCYKYFFLGFRYAQYIPEGFRYIKPGLVGTKPGNQYPMYYGSKKRTFWLNVMVNRLFPPRANGISLNSNRQKGQYTGDIDRQTKAWLDVFPLPPPNEPSLQAYVVWKDKNDHSKNMRDFILWLLEVAQLDENGNSCVAVGDTAKYQQEGVMVDEDGNINMSEYISDRGGMFEKVLNLKTIDQVSDEENDDVDYASFLQDDHAVRRQVQRKSGNKKTK